jgi:hypothetical protein
LIIVLDYRDVPELNFYPLIRHESIVRICEVIQANGYGKDADLTMPRGNYPTVVVV